VELRPELVIVEAEMPGIDGRETAHLFEQALPETRVVLVSSDGAPDLRTLTPEAPRALWADGRPD
jgi:DNA-binding NarL/FixJ family response regulator